MKLEYGLRPDSALVFLLSRTVIAYHRNKNISCKLDISKVTRLLQDVLNVIEKERPEGIIVQFGGQTPLSIAKPLQEALLKNPVQAASGEICAFTGPPPSPNLR